jgi:protein TonB
MSAAPDPVRAPVALRLPYRTRQRKRREIARARAARLTKTPLTAAQRETPPPKRRSPIARALVLLAWAAGSFGMHAGVVIIAVVIGALRLSKSEAASQQVSVEIREHEAPPPEPEPDPAKAAPEQAPVAPAAAIRLPVAPPAGEPDPAPSEPDKAPPVRVVGISLEATTEGGDGPAFGVGNTLGGKTEAVAAKPVKSGPPGPAAGVASAAPSATGANRAATRIPTLGSKIVLPKRRRPRMPSYPADLKSQGIEADVTVMVNLDATGKVTSVKVIAPSPHAAFNQAAEAAARGEDFEPAMRDGVAMPYTLSFTYRFRIQQ